MDENKSLDLIDRKIQVLTRAIDVAKRKQDAHIEISADEIVKMYRKFWAEVCAPEDS